MNELLNHISRCVFLSSIHGVPDFFFLSIFVFNSKLQFVYWPMDRNLNFNQTEDDFFGIEENV